MKWTENHDIMLCREILTAVPFKNKGGSRERGQRWERVVNALNKLKDPSFSVTKRGVRERHSLIEAAYKKKDKAEIKATGISPEVSELDEAIMDIMEQFCYWDEQFKSCSDEKKQKLQEDQTTAEEMRQRAMERQGQTIKRHSEDQPNKKRMRTSSTETIQFLQEKAEKEFQLRREEMELKQKEQQNTQTQQRNMFEFFQAQQQLQSQQMTQMIQQQQQQSQALVDLLSKLNNK